MASDLHAKDLLNGQLTAVVRPEQTAISRGLVTQKLKYMKFLMKHMNTEHPLKAPFTTSPLPKSYGATMIRTRLSAGSGEAKGLRGHPTTV
ncbi:hypothetical protein ACFX2J_039713 [Malus domestica]